MTKRHLDLGCGLSPRNPYGYQDLYGCDIRNITEEVGQIGFEYRQVNLVTQTIPFPDHYFDSISAFDFLEHIPRQIVMPNGESKSPFIDLMNEIHRVLVPGGKFLALTPAYPHASVFSDPTHVNFITEDTHVYFTGSNPGGRMYGFKGTFDIVRVGWETPGNVYQVVPPFAKWLRRIHRKMFRGGLSHQVWEFIAR